MADSGPCRCGRGTLYDVLQVSPWCEPEVIQAAYRALARSRHPDLNRDPSAEEQMRRLNVAYQTLSDPARRLRYDEELALESARPPVGRTGPAGGASFDATGRPRPAEWGRGADWGRTAPGERPRNGAGGGPTHNGAASQARNGAVSGQARAASADGPARNGGAAGPTRSATRPAVAAPGAAAETAGASSAWMADVRGEMLLPRSALYVSIVLVTAILALLFWLVIDTLADRPAPAMRGPRAQQERRVVGPRPAAAVGWPAAEPALSLPGERLNRSSTAS